MTQTVSIVSSSTVKPVIPDGSLVVTNDDAILVGVWSTQISVTDDSTFTASPAFGGTAAVQVSPDGTNWAELAGSPYRTTFTGGVPPGVIYIRATATGGTATLSVSTPALSYYMTSGSTQGGFNIAPVVASDLGRAAGNTALINSLLEDGGDAIIPGGLGVVWCDGTLILWSNSRLFIGYGTTLKSVSGRQQPLLRNKYAGHIHNQPLFNRLNNVVTVTDAGHTVSVGDLIFISGANATFDALATVSTVVPRVSWSYPLAGADGSAGATGTFFNVVPVKRTLAGTAFSATANYVTVQDPGHDIRPGMNIFIGKNGGSNFAPGVVQVASVTADTWSYQTSSATGTDSGTLALSYDYNIDIVGGGTIDGNRAAIGTPSNGNVMLACTAVFGCVSQLTIDCAIGGTPLRAINALNCSAVNYRENWRPFDCLVGAQHEGGLTGCVVDQGVYGASAINTTGAQQIDDYVAFTGTAFASGAGGNYDNTISPYGLTSFSGIEVRRIYPIECLNGIKVTAHSSCPFVGTIKIGSVIGRFLNNNFSLGQGGALTMFDDGPGLAGTTVEAFDIVGPIEWKTPAASTACLNLGGAGSIGSLQVRNTLAESGQSTTIKTSNTLTIKVLDVDASKFIPLATNAPSMNLSGGTIRKLKVRNSRVQMGSSQPFIYFNGATVNEVEIDSVQVSGNAAATGNFLDFATSPTVSRITIRGLRIEQGGNTISRVFNLADLSFGTVDVYLDDVDITSASFFSSAGTALTGTFNVFFGKKVRWAATGGNNFFQVGGCTWNVYADPSNRATLPATKVFLTGFGTPTYKSLGFGQAVASGTTPALNCGLGNYVTFTATAASTWGAPSNVPPAGATVTVVITQDATGGWAISWNAAYIFPTAFSNTGNTAGKKTTVCFVSDGTALVAQGTNSWY